jgi:hypothetical protein
MLRILPEIRIPAGIFLCPAERSNPAPKSVWGCGLAVRGAHVFVVPLNAAPLAAVHRFAGPALQEPMVACHRYKNER